MSSARERLKKKLQDRQTAPVTPVPEVRSTSLIPPAPPPPIDRMVSNEPKPLFDDLVIPALRRLTSQPQYASEPIKEDRPAIAVVCEPIEKCVTLMEIFLKSRTILCPTEKTLEAGLAKSLTYIGAKNEATPFVALYLATEELYETAINILMSLHSRRVAGRRILGLNEQSIVIDDDVCGEDRCFTYDIFDQCLRTIHIFKCSTQISHREATNLLRLKANQLLNRAIDVTKYAALEIEGVDCSSWAKRAALHLHTKKQ